jgi:hypothetical protein
VKVRVGIAREGQRRQTWFFDRDAEFLAKFPDKRRFRTLAWFDLAAGKLPEPGQVFAFGPLAQKNAPVGIDKRDSDNEKQFGQER